MGADEHPIDAEIFTFKGKIMKMEDKKMNIETNNEVLKALQKFLSIRKSYSIHIEYRRRSNPFKNSTF